MLRIFFMFILPLWLNIVDSCSKSDTGIKVTYDYESDYVSDTDGEKFDYQYEPDDVNCNLPGRLGCLIMGEVWKVQKVFMTPPPPQ